jgi:stage V sporulation protein S
MIKVSATSRTAAVAGAIAGVVREHHRAEVQAIGAGAVNQAMKALILATGYLRLDGIHVHCVPEFADVTMDDNVRTAIKLIIEPDDGPHLSEDQELLFRPKSMGRTSPQKPFDPNIRNESSVFPS